MRIIYKQNKKSSFNVYFPFIFLFCFCIWILIKNNLNFNILSIIFLITVLIVFVLAHSFLKLSFEIRDDGLKFGFGILKYFIEKKEILLIGEGNSKDYFYSQGITIGRDKMLGFVARRGDGIVLELRSGKKMFISLDDTKNIKKILKENGYV